MPNVNTITAIPHMLFLFIIFRSLFWHYRPWYGRVVGSYPFGLHTFRASRAARLRRRLARMPHI
jgi:hypothetical protein